MKPMTVPDTELAYIKKGMRPNLSSQKPHLIKGLSAI